MREALLERVDPSSRAALEELFTEPLEDLGSLRDGIRAYTAGVRAMARSDERVDVETAVAIASQCESLLDAATGADEEVRRMVQVACHYYVLSFDEEGDGDLGADGFSDDLAVVQAVAALI